jgi:hypothetical protein
LYDAPLAVEITRVEERLRRLNEERCQMKTPVERGLLAISLQQLEIERRQLLKRARQQATERLQETAPRWRSIEGESETAINQAVADAERRGLVAPLVDDTLAAFYVARQQAGLAHVAPPPQSGTSNRLVLRYPRGLPLRSMLAGLASSLQMERHDGATIMHLYFGRNILLAMPIRYEPPLASDTVIHAAVATRVSGKKKSQASWSLSVTSLLQPKK